MPSSRREKMDPVSAAQSISALILLQMEPFTDGQHFYIIWPPLPLSCTDLMSFPGTYAALETTKEEQAPTPVLLFCLQLRRLTIMLHSDIWKNVVTHSVRERGAKWPRWSCWRSAGGKFQGYWFFFSVFLFFFTVFLK